MIMHNRLKLIHSKVFSVLALQILFVDTCTSFTGFRFYKKEISQDYCCKKIELVRQSLRFFTAYNKGVATAHMSFGCCLNMELHGFA
jgi:hypothetical protein